MAVAALVGAIAFGAAGTAIQNRATAKAASGQVDELTRQEQRERSIAREKKSDRAREADIALGTLIAAHADTGGTIASLARGAGEIGGITGLDTARIESNRKERARAIRSQQISIVHGARTKILGSTISFFAKSLGSVASFKNPQTATTPKAKFKPTAQSGGE